MTIKKMMNKITNKFKMLKETIAVRIGRIFKRKGHDSTLDDNIVQDESNVELPPEETLIEEIPAEELHRESSALKIILLPFITFLRRAARLKKITKQDLSTFLEDSKEAFLEVIYKSRHDQEKNQNGKKRKDLKFTISVVFAPKYRPKIHQIFLCTFLFLLTTMLGKELALLLTPQRQEVPSVPIDVKIPNDSMTAENLEILKNNNLFQTKLSDAVSPSPTPSSNKLELCKESESISNLPVVMLNSVVLHNSKKSVASLQIRSSSEIENVREGETLHNMFQVGKIDRLKIIVRNLQSSQCEVVISNELKEDRQNSPNFTVLSPGEGKKLMKEQIPEGIKNEGNHFAISRKLLNEKLEDINNILTQARAIQIPNPDGSLTFKVTEIIPGSIFSYLGIENEDQISQINGKKIKGLNDVMNLFGTIQDVDNLSLTIVKGDGTEQTLDYEFSK